MRYILYYIIYLHTVSNPLNVRVNIGISTPADYTLTADDTLATYAIKKINSGLDICTTDHCSVGPYSVPQT